MGGRVVKMRRPRKPMVDEFERRCWPVGSNPIPSSCIIKINYLSLFYETV